MAEIHYIAPLEQRDDVQRHLAALVHAVETGADLGSRGFHIRSLGLSLERMLAELQRHQEKLIASPEAATPEAQKLLSYIPNLLGVLEPLIKLVRTFD